MQRSQFDALLADLVPQAVATPSASFSNSGVDSLGVVNLLVAIEDTFGVEFDDQSLAGGTDMSPDSLYDTASALVAA